MSFGKIFSKIKTGKIGGFKLFIIILFAFLLIVILSTGVVVCSPLILIGWIIKLYHDRKMVEKEKDFIKEVPETISQLVKMKNGYQKTEINDN